MAKRVFTEEERAEYREKMLDAGFDLLKQYGMTHMSVAKITEAAGIGVSTFYNFFASKEEYVYEVLQYRRRKIPELIRIALNGKEKAGPAETRTYLKMMIDERYSVFPSLTPEDEKRLLEMLPEQVRPERDRDKYSILSAYGRHPPGCEYSACGEPDQGLCACRRGKRDAAPEGVRSDDGSHAGSDLV